MRAGNKTKIKPQKKTGRSQAAEKDRQKIAQAGISTIGDSGFLSAFPCTDTRLIREGPSDNPG